MTLPREMRAFKARNDVVPQSATQSARRINLVNINSYAARAT
jgi:hypothetical protein